MKAVILYNTRTGNTKKVANAIARGVGCRAKDVTEARLPDVSPCKLVGFGSGVYFGKPGKELLLFAERLRPAEGKKAFVFTTYGGLHGENAGEEIRKKISEKGFKVIGEHRTKAYDNWGPLKLVGGINKGKPDARDLKKAEEFGKKMAYKVRL
jgi:flavodoxin